MKRVIVILIAGGLIYFAAKRVSLHFKPIAEASATAPTPVPQSNSKPQTVITSLPPLTNLVFKQHRRAAQQMVAQTAPAPETNEIQSASPAPPKKSGKPPRQDPFARVALAMVGADPAAEEYWALAINDPSLSDSEREDLIEDLNEEGFEDPKNPTVDELPLIVSRLEIIEEHAPFAMDDVNARSFAEAYKDLVNMYVRLTGQQPP